MPRLEPGIVRIVSAGYFSYWYLPRYKASSPADNDALNEYFLKTECKFGLFAQL